MNKINKVKDFIDFKNDDLINIPSNIGFHQLSDLKNAVEREIIRIEKEKTQEKLRVYYDSLRDWNNLLLIVSSNRINLEKIPFNNNYMKIKGMMRL